MNDRDTPISWITLSKGVGVFAADGKQIGAVGEVVADRQKDIFSGITLSGGLFGTERFVPAELIEKMTANGVHLTILEEEVEALEPYEG